MKIKFECSLNLTPGENDELFESKDSLGGYIKVFGYGNSQKEFLAAVKQVVSEYGSNIVSIYEFEVSDVCFEDYPCYKGIYFSSLHTYDAN
jgi:hypothetical protein